MSRWLGWKGEAPNNRAAKYANSQGAGSDSLEGGKPSHCQKISGNIIQPNLIVIGYGFGLAFTVYF